MQYLFSQDVREAWEDGSYESAFQRARMLLEEKDLEAGLRLTIATIEQDLVLYDALAARWIAQVYEAKHFPRHHFGWAAYRFDEAREPLRRDSAENLFKLLR